MPFNHTFLRNSRDLKMTQLLMSDDDVTKLKIQLLECVKELREAGGPAACRFHKKLSYLIDDIERCRQNQTASQSQLDSVQRKLHETRNNVHNVTKTVDESQTIIDIYKDEIGRYDQLSSNLDETTRTRNHEVR